MAYAPKPKTILKKKHELAKLLKRLDEASMDAVDVLVNTIRSTEESVSPKMKAECAEVLLNFQIKVADVISKDQITRAVADFKLNNGSHQLVDNEGRSKAPMLNFEDVQLLE